jgi:hypothetical protein
MGTRSPLSLILVTATFAASDAGAATWTVGPTDSIQTAVDAAERGDRVVVSGDHAEQVIIRKDISLVGAPGARLSMPGGPLARIPVLVVPEENLRVPYAAVIAVEDADVTIEGFEIDGGFGGDADSTAGVLFHHADGALRDSVIHGFAGSAYPVLSRGPGSQADFCYGAHLFFTSSISLVANDFVDLAAGVLLEDSAAQLSANHFSGVPVPTYVLPWASADLTDRASRITDAPRPGRGRRLE